MRNFYKLLVSSLLAGTTNSFVWFALTYWIFLETKSVLSTAFMGGIYLVVMAGSSFLFGAIVDHYKKKHAMIGSSIASLILFSAGFALYVATPPEAWTTVASFPLWLLVITLLSGTIAGTIYQISIPTLVTVLVPEDLRDRANGLFGMTAGFGFAITSIASGLVLGFFGLFYVLLSAIILTAIALVYISLLTIPEPGVVHTHTDEEPKKRVDIRGTIRAIQSIPGLFPLIFFTTFNNFLGGVFFALMDAYGLTLVSVQVWGVLWGFLSLGFILGGFLISRWGLGRNPLATLFQVNMATWTVCIFFAIQPSIILLAIGSLIWLTLFPYIEAVEQTIVQKVVPYERQGRVFGFAHSVEQAASPLTAFMIGPIAQFIFIPFMTTGRGVDLIGDWFGTGMGRGIALVFMLAGIVGLLVTILAKRSKAYFALSAQVSK